MQRHIWLWLVVLALVGGGLCGCGGSGGGGGATDQTAFLSAAGTKWDTLSHADPGAASTAMVDWLRTLPDVAEASVTNDLIVLAQLKDGTTVGWVDDAYLNASGRAIAPPYGAAPRRAIPTGKTAYLFQSDLFTLDVARTDADIRPQLASILQSAGYTVVQGKGTLDEFRAISPTDCGLLWTNSHGTIAKGHYYMASSTSPSASDERPGGRYYDDLHTGRLIRLKNTGQSYYYWFSGAWLQNNVRFPLGGFAVWINSACEGVTTPEMKDAAFHQGLSAYVAWDESVLWQVANRAALYLVDRMTGANAVDPVLSPKQRAFGLSAVVAEMDAQKPPLTVSSVDVPWFYQYLPPPFNSLHSVTAHLRVATNPFAGQPTDQQFTQLNPSIRSMSVDQTADNETTLTIVGAFGPIPGKVTIDGKAATLASNGWKPSTIQCLLPPASQPGGSGDVVVEVEGRRSNPVPLTAWKLSIHTESDADHSGTVVVIPGEGTARDVLGDLSGKSHTSADLEVWVRADVHTFRDTPGQTALNDAFRNTFVTHNARKTRDARVVGWNASGTVTTQIHYDGEAPYDTWTDSVSAAGATPILYDGSDPRGLPSNAAATIDPAARTMRFSPFLTATGLYKSVHTTANPASRTESIGGSQTFVPSDGAGGTKALVLTLDSNFGVVAGALTQASSDPASGVTETRTLRWSGQVFHAPTPATAR